MLNIHHFDHGVDEASRLNSKSIVSVILPWRRNIQPSQLVAKFDLAQTASQPAQANRDLGPNGPSQVRTSRLSEG